MSNDIFNEKAFNAYVLLVVKESSVTRLKKMLNEAKIKELIRHGKSATLEFKEAGRDSLPSSLFDTICAFLNAEGGIILLGVRDDGEVSGIHPDCVAKLKADLAKLAGYKLAYYYAKQYGMNTISIMPCNLYGKNDHFDLEKAHVLSSLVKRFVDAVDKGKTEVKLWGTGRARREFMNVDDFAEAAVMLMRKRSEPEIINVGTADELTIRDLALKIAKSAGYKGRILWDKSMPDGMPRKCLDISKIRKLGFNPKISLDTGIDQMISEYRIFTTNRH